MGAPQALAFLLFAFIAAVTPGPSNTMILSTGTAVGALRGLPCSIGASLGMGTMIAVSALGVGETVADAPMIVVAMKLAGSLFLLWLAWKIANAGPFEVKGRTKVAGFADAFLFQWLNPKGWLVALSAGTTYLIPGQHDGVGAALWMGALFAVAALPAGLFWLGMGALITHFLSGQRSAKIFNIVMASALAGSVIMVWR